MSILTAEAQIARSGRLLLAFGFILCASCQAPPSRAPAGFEIHPDFTIELVAAEPTIVDPVDLEWDERGRVFVLEMPGYPSRDEDGRVVLVEDSNGDGVWDQRRVFADGFPVADSILPYRGGLLVASPPDLVFLEDLDDDGVAEKRTVLLSGFADDNTQHNFNGLTHGIDNWIYGANGGNSGDIFWPDRPEEKTPLRFDDFRFDLERRRFERTGRSSGGFGMSFDSWGRSFSTHNLHHVSQLVFPGRYLRGLPSALQSSRERISDHGSDGPARIYPIGAQDTRVNHPEQAGYFSGATGLTIYTGGGFGREFEDDLFVADVVLNLVHRAGLGPGPPAGSSLVAWRRRAGVEFLASRDRSFRPVNLTVGPDGALYVVDMRRRVIEHPEWIPDEIEAELDLREGRAEGRIYRVASKSGLERTVGRLDRSDHRSLVRGLTHVNLWWRATAQRLLVEERAVDAIPALERMLVGAEARGRLHAAWTLEGLNALSDRSVGVLLDDFHPRLREHAVRLAEPRLEHAEALLSEVLDQVDSKDGGLRLQVALTLGSAWDPGSGADLRVKKALLSLAAEAFSDEEWIPRAVFAGFARGGVQGLEEILRCADGRDSQDLGERFVGLCASLLERMAWTLPVDEMGALLGSLAASGRDSDAGIPEVLAGFGHAIETDREAASSVRLGAQARTWLKEAGDRPATMRSALRLAVLLGMELTIAQRGALVDAGQQAIDENLPMLDRASALDLLAVAPYSQRRETLLSLLGHKHPAPLQRAALEQLRDATDPSLGRDLLDRWDRLGPSLRADAGTLLLRRPVFHELLLTALENGAVTVGEMQFDLERRRTLLKSRVEGVRLRAGALFSDAGVVTRGAALDSMRPALDLDGDPAAGHRLFSDLCARCHRFVAEGSTLAPDLTEISRKSAETLLHDIVDPNAAVEHEYVTYIVETDDGVVRTGLVRDETDEGFVLVEGDGARTAIPRRGIVEMWSDGLSLMPEELEVGMDAKAMANLLAFLQRPIHR